MKMKRSIVLSLMVLLMIGLSQVNGGIMTFDKRTDWEDAVGGNSFFWEENFNTFTVDTEFKTKAVYLEEFSLQQQGPDALSGYNYIDVSPFKYVNIDDSPYALALVNHDTVDTTVDMVFDAPIWAWGAEFNLGYQGELLALVTFGSGTTEVIDVLNPAGAFFFGFTTDPAEWIDSITFQPQKTLSNTVEAFAMDNVVGSPTTPEPTAFLIWLLLGCLGINAVCWRRRKVA